MSVVKIPKLVGSTTVYACAKCGGCHTMVDVADRGDGPYIICSKTASRVDVNSFIPLDETPAPAARSSVSSPAEELVPLKDALALIKNAWSDGCNCMANHSGYNSYVLGYCGQAAKEAVLQNGKRPKELKDSSNEFVAAAEATLRATPAAVSPSIEKESPHFQSRVASWMQETFGPEVSADFTERGFRFGEEAIELLQANGTTKEDVLKLVDYVYSRPIGELQQEVGGTMVTLAALCQARGIDLAGAANAEQTRVESPEIRAKIQAKQADKRARMIATPLPGNAPAHV